MGSILWKSRLRIRDGQRLEVLLAFDFFLLVQIDAIDAIAPNCFHLLAAFGRRFGAEKSSAIGAG